jgi:Ca2+/Na+ antiporter
MSRLPELGQKALAAGGLGAILGGTLGGVLSGTFFSIFVGVFCGWAAAVVIAYAFRRQLAKSAFQRARRSTNFFFSILSTAMTVAGIIGVVKTGRWSALFAVAFFAFAAVYLFASTKRDDE